MFNKNKFFALLLTIVTGACSSTTENSAIESPKKAATTVKQNKEEPKVTHTPEGDMNDTLKYQHIDSLVRNDIQHLDKRYPSTPFYTQIKGGRYYVVCSGKWEYEIERFAGTLKYGLVNDALEVVLEPVFDKIYNPNITMAGCFEVKKDSKVGLFKIETGQILEPQFDYIMPAARKAGKIAYGIKNKEWYEINSDPHFTVTPATTFSPVSLLQMLWFDVNEVGENLMYDSYSNIDREYDPLTGKGVVILPSYLECLNLLSSDHFADIIVADQQEVDFGTTALKMKTDKEKTFYDKIKAFVVASYEEGVDARGYAINSNKLVVYNSQNNNLVSVGMGGGPGYYLCEDYSYNFVNDSIIEVRSSSGGERYDFQTSYSYFKITREGEIKELKSNRQYNYTKFIVINEDYFKGCFASAIDPAQQTGSENMYVSEHLSIEDLDIMRNEIFAEYGYTFKTEKWKNYFAQWYTPQYENVDDQLTEIDKANINIILKVRKAMENNEDEYTKKGPVAYYPPG